MLNLTTGLSALRADQRALDVIANNIANASTPSYHRQAVQLADRAPIEIDGQLVGTGVDVARIRQFRNITIETALTRNISDRGNADQQLDALSQIESFLTPGSGSVHERLQSFFNNLQQLSTNPNDAALRRIVLQGASSLAGELNAVYGNFVRFSRDLESEITQTVDQINRYAESLAQVNKSIQVAINQGANPNDLLDQRDQLVSQVAELIGVQLSPQGTQQAVNLINGGVLASDRSSPLHVITDESGVVQIRMEGFSDPIPVTGGKLAGLLEARNKILPEFQDQLSALSNALIQSVDAVQSTGLGPAGPFQILNGSRGVQSVSAPLSSAETAFPVSAGDLYVSVTQNSSGLRTTTRVAIDPATQSLQDIAAALSGVAHIQAVVNTQTNTLTVLAEQGYSFDFAGRPETSLDLSAFTGSSSPALSGVFAGAANDNYQFKVVGTGTVGVTPGLTVEVRNAAGQLVNSLNVGAGYEAGTTLAVADGIGISFDAGTLNDGDLFTSPMVAKPDTSGLLVALGLNSFFSGTTAGDIRVNDDLLKNPYLLSTSRTGQPGDVGNLQRLLALRDASTLAGGTQTFEEYLNDMTVRAGAQVSQQKIISDNLENLGSRLQDDWMSYSGVDPNEELVSMIQYQRAFQAASQYLATVNDTLDSLFRILG